MVDDWIELDDENWIILRTGEDGDNGSNSENSDDILIDELEDQAMHDKGKGSKFHYFNHTYNVCEDIYEYNF